MGKYIISFAMLLCALSISSIAKEYEGVCSNLKLVNLPKPLQQLIIKDAKFTNAVNNKNSTCHFINIGLNATDQPNYFSFMLGKECTAYLYMRTSKNENCTWQPVNCVDQDNLISDANYICHIQ